MKREDYIQNPVKPIKINGLLTVNELVRQFKNSGSFGAGRLATACDVYEKMVRDKKCTVFLALSGAVIPAGMYWRQYGSRRHRGIGWASL
jgi:deoxyhypusine synthase